MTTTHFSVGAVRLSRVAYAEVSIDPAKVGLSADQVTQISWASPVWADDARVRVAAAIWVIETNGRRIVVDPALTADEILRSGPEAEVHQQAVADILAAAGFPRDSVDLVIASHLDGIGMIAWLSEGRWSPFFPKATVLISRREYAAITSDGEYRASGSDALLALHDLGVVAEVDDVHVVTDEVTIRWTGGHSPGHQIVEISSQGEEAAIIGHLTLSPLHCVIDECALHVEPARAASTLRELRDRRQIMIGPLWPTPGAARWTGAEMLPIRSR